MSKVEILEVDKETAAGCQIDTAIYLFANEFCEVSSITLAYAGWKIIRDISKSKGIVTTSNFLSDAGISYSQIDSIFSFFKHGKNDANKIQQFPKGYAEGVIACAVQDFKKLKQISESMDTFILWFIAKNKFTETQFTEATDDEIAIYEDSRYIFPERKFKKENNPRKILLRELKRIYSKPL